jgi:hypothetical protein
MKRPGLRVPARGLESQRGTPQRWPAYLSIHNVDVLVTPPALGDALPEGNGHCRLVLARQMVRRDKRGRA